MEFEKVLKDLEDIAKKMEDKDTTLDESLKLLEKVCKKVMSVLRL